MGAHFWPKYEIKDFFFSPTKHCRIDFKKKNVCVQEANLGKVAKFIPLRSREVFFKNQNYFTTFFPSEKNF